MIEFITERAEMPRIDTGLIQRWVEKVAALHDRTIGEICYVFCNDEYILQTNREFLQHDYYTDIITFDYTRGKRIGGDLVISLETVASNAEGLAIPYSRELLRVMIHGVLHLCGINDKGPGEREVMESHEDKALEIYDNLSTATL